MNLAKPYQLTKYPIGSIREIWTIGWPLMLGILASSVMIFSDRLMLARYSIEAMTGAVTAGTAGYSFIVLPLIIAGITEVFVGQYHGHDSKKMIGKAVWQMLWFSIMTIPYFILVGSFGPGILFKNTLFPRYATDFFSIFVSFGFVNCLSMALMGFFAGRGKVRFVALVTIFANLLNIGLDYILIYGFAHIPSLGVKGASIATVISQCAMVVIFGMRFLQRENKKEYGTHLWKFNFPMFYRAVKIGFPASVAHTSEMFSSFMFFMLLNQTGDVYLMVCSLMQTVYLLFFFVIEGLSKGVIAICSNLIGAKEYSLVIKNIFSSCKLHAIFFCLIFFLVLFFSPGIFSPFFNEKSTWFFENPVFVKALFKTSLWLCLVFLFDGFGWVLGGFLTAAGDTKYIMIVGIIAPWLLYYLPVYLGLNYFHISVDKVWFIAMCYTIGIVGIYGLRYRSKKWKKIRI
ncbi:MAG TPA: MATE family efflux transporter [Chlamydiales bacterium]|nr:MATE family efflux transporter [Chlamydiales bacterium]